MGDWQPIETAPKDGSLIDVWCTRLPTDDEFGYREATGAIQVLAIRLTDVSWGDGGWVRITDTGNFDYVEGEPCDDSGLPPWAPTHWMPLPEPPNA